MFHWEETCTNSALGQYPPALREFSVRTQFCPMKNANSHKMSRTRLNGYKDEESSPRPETTRQPIKGDGIRY